MITPQWLETRSQPIAIADVIAALAALAIRADAPAEVQLGGADVLTYREMLRRFAAVAGPPPAAAAARPALHPAPVVLLGRAGHARRSSGLVKPLVEGLSAETVVREPPPPGLNDAPLGFDDAVRAALAR